MNHQHSIKYSNKIFYCLQSAHWDEILGVVIYWSFYGQEPSMAANLRDEEDIVTALKLIRFHFINDKVLEVSYQSKHGFMHLQNTGRTYYEIYFSSP